MSSYCEWKFIALTDIWTGDANQRADRFIPTGLMGSLRWWFEVLVRGLGGTACDPTSPVRCPDHKVKNPTSPGHHCIVCELFGCTGWARKFRLRVLDKQGDVIQNQINAGKTFVLRFIPLRSIRPEEWCLLDCTLRLIAEYGAIGGKTVLKPSDEPNRRNYSHHQDFGLIQYLSGPFNEVRKDRFAYVYKYVQSVTWRKVSHEYTDKDYTGKEHRHDFSWASLQNFWCVKGCYLARQDGNKSTFNRVIGRPEEKGRAYQGDSWLAGRRASGGNDPESKKVFSFKHPQEGGRTFGFAKPGTVDFNEMKRRLHAVWRDFKDDKFLTGQEILKIIGEGVDQ